MRRGDGYDERDGFGSFLVGPAGGPLVEVRATDLAFVNDEQVLTMEPRAGGIHLKTLRADSPGVRLWEHHVPGILTAQIATDAEGRRWQAVGFDGGRRIVRVDGIVGDVSPPQRWNTDQPSGSLLAVAASGAATVAVETHYAPAIPQSLGLWRLGAWLPVTSMESRIWSVSHSERFEIGTSHLDVRCASVRVGEPQIVCVTYEGTRSRFVAIDARNRTVSGIGLLPGRFFTGARVSGGWLPGWYDGSSVAVRLETGEVIRVESGRDDFVLTEVSGTGLRVGAVLQNGSGSKIRVYSLDE